MGTKIFGASDDLIEFRGDVYGEVAHYDDEPAIIICSDASILTIKYGKSQLAIWEIALLNRGSLFDRIEDCTDEDAEIYSDIAYFSAGLKFAYVAKEWQRAK